MIYDQILLLHQIPCSENCIHCQPLEETQVEEIAPAYDHALEIWAKILELRDKATASHSRRVIDLTFQLARQLGITEPELTHIHRGVLLHDIGKMAVPDQILKKAGPLDNDEWDEMRKHPQYAYDLLCPILSTTIRKSHGDN